MPFVSAAKLMTSVLGGSLPLKKELTVDDWVELFEGIGKRLAIGTVEAGEGATRQVPLLVCIPMHLADRLAAVTGYNDSSTRQLTPPTSRRFSRSTT